MSVEVIYYLLKLFDKHHTILVVLSRTKLPFEGMRIQIELRGEVCELELSGASRRVLMSNQGGTGTIKSSLIDSGGETTVVRINVFCRDSLECSQQLRI